MLNFFTPFVNNKIIIVIKTTVNKVNVITIIKLIDNAGKIRYITSGIKVKTKVNTIESKTEILCFITLVSSSKSSFGL